MLDLLCYLIYARNEGDLVGFQISISLFFPPTEDFSSQVFVDLYCITLLLSSRISIVTALTNTIGSTSLSTIKDDAGCRHDYQQDRFQTKPKG